MKRAIELGVQSLEEREVHPVRSCTVDDILDEYNLYKDTLYKDLTRAAISIRI